MWKNKGARMWILLPNLSMKNFEDISIKKIYFSTSPSIFKKPLYREKGLGRFPFLPFLVSNKKVG